MGKGILPISLEALEQILTLPEGYRVLSTSIDQYKQTINLLVESPDIPEVEEFCEFPRVMPRYKQKDFAPDYELTGIDIEPSKAL